LAEQLEAAEARARQMQTLADQVPGLRKDVQRYRDKLDAAEAHARSLEADLDSRKKLVTDSSRLLESLERDKRALAEEASRARAAADNRFAGIALTGRRVVFLIDIS